MLHGRKLIVFKNGIAIACARSCEITSEGEVIEVASTSSAKARKYIRGRYGWIVTCSCLVSTFSDATEALTLVENDTVEIRFGYTGQTSSVGGDALCTSCKVTGTIGNLIQMSVEFRGSGDLTDTNDGEELQMSDGSAFLTSDARSVVVEEEETT